MKEDRTLFNVKEKLTFENNSSEDLLTAAEVVAEFPVFSRPALWRWAREGKVPSILLPSRRRLFRRSDIQALLMPEEDQPMDTLGEIDQVLPGLEGVS